MFINRSPIIIGDNYQYNADIEGFELIKDWYRFSYEFFFVKYWKSTGNRIFRISNDVIVEYR